MYVSLGPILSLDCCFFSCHFSFSSHALHRSNCHWHCVVKIHLEFSFFFYSFLLFNVANGNRMHWRLLLYFPILFTYSIWNTRARLTTEKEDDSGWFCSLFYRKCSTLLNSTFLLFVSLSFVVTIRITFHEVKTMNDDLFDLYIFSYLSTIEWRLF